jgi:hypothetical protein
MDRIPEIPRAASCRRGIFFADVKRSLKEKKTHFLGLPYILLVVGLSVSLSVNLSVHELSH